MFSVSSSLRCLVPQWRRRSGNFWILFHSNRTVRIASSSSMNEDSASLRKQSQPDFDPAEDLFGLDVDLQPRNVVSGAPKPRSWFGPNGQYIRELPCPSCRGRGYTPCTECGIERSRLDCSECNGKGLRTCKQCLGDCVIWEESIDERPWEKARSSSPLKVKEDDEVDKLDIKFDVTRKSKRVYQSPSPEVSLKISRSLRSLNAKTGLFSKRMKILHRDPTLHAQRVAAIKKAKGTAAARKKASETMKTFFRHPENRIKRSMSMIGVKFYCSNCGEEGHRRYYCPAVKDSLGGQHKFKCRLCGERGHNRRTCPKSRSGEPQRRRVEPKHHHHCTVCGQGGHNRRTCPQGTAGMKGGSSIPNKILTTSKGIKFYCSNCGEEGHRRNHCPALEESLGGRHKCRLCGEKGHNRRTCPKSRLGEPQRRRWDQRHHQHCRVCGNSGHNRRTCPQGTGLKSSSSTPNKVLQSYKGKTYSCSLCSVKGHNIRTCPNRDYDLMDTP